MNLLCFLSIFVLSGAPLSEENDQEDRCHFHYVDIDHPLTLQQIQEKYTAYDTKDGMITDRIQFITDYDENHLTLGTYPLTVIVQNSQQQSTTQTDYIVVRDFIPPVLSAKEEIIYKNVGDTLSNSELFSYFECTDNREEITSEQMSVSGLPSGPLKEGNYSITVFCFDSSTNSSNTVTIVLSVLNDYSNTALSYTFYADRLNITPEEIMNDLEKNQFTFTSVKNFEIESTYFQANKDGIYLAKLIVTHLDETKECFSFKIELKLHKKNTNWHWIVIGILGIGTVGFFLWYWLRKTNQ